VVNSILWGNKAGGLPNEIYLAYSSTIKVTYSDIEGGWPGAGNIKTDPLFVDAANGDYHLKSTPISPCTDKGIGDTTTYPNIPINDIDGDLRPYDGDNNGVPQYDMVSDESVKATTPPLNLAIDIIINQSTYTTGDTLVIKARTTNDNSPDDVSKAIWLEFPDKTKLSFSLGDFTIPANDDTTTIVLTYTLTGTEKAGEYKVGGRLIDRTMTLEELSFDTETFTVTQ